MKPTVKQQLTDELMAREVSGADADKSETPAGIFSNLDSDDGIGYDPEHDPTPELEKKRIRDK